MIKNVVVFCGNGCAEEKKKYYYDLSYNLGKSLAVAGFTTITGGGVGLMDEALRGAYETGGKTIGICLIKEGRKQSTHITKREDYDFLSKRQESLIKTGDAFIALPGGYGTLLETIEVIDRKKIEEIDRKKPLVLLTSYFNPLIVLFNHMFLEGFIEELKYKFYKQIETIEEAIKYLKNI